MHFYLCLDDISSGRLLIDSSSSESELELEEPESESESELELLDEELEDSEELEISVDISSLRTTKASDLKLSFVGSFRTLD